MITINTKGELQVEVTPLAKREEIYTKNEVVAMLTELKTEIDEMQCLYVDFAHYVNEYDVSNLIQQKIDKMRRKDGNNS